MFDRSEKIYLTEEEKPGFPGCPVSYAIGLLNGKWKMQIIYDVSRNTVIRFNSLRRSVGGISNLMLAKSLQDLENDRIIERRQFNEMPPRVEYSLAPLGKALIPIIEQLGRWGEDVWRVKSE